MPASPACPVNVRDLGGLPLLDGGRTAPGVLLRGDAPYAGDVAPSGVAWPPAAVLDLRAAHERRRSPYPWPATTTVTPWPLGSIADPAHLGTRSILDVYAELLEVAAPRIATVLPQLSADGATFVHCAAGKDRTGLVIGALLLLAGVTPEAVVADYERTQERMDAVVGRLTTFADLHPDGMRPEWLTAPAEAIGLLLEAVGDDPAAWFIRHGADGGDVDRWRDRIRAG
ncbi:tyrosine-protein phosphatase [Nocardioides sp.]|uniref:tyrosine-protein phosphatase n=1 Tax=Nocardioides sp. TaxID=35761 RepID=UPI0035172FD6